MPDLTVARTEHGLAVVNGIPTVVGGVAAQEFLASVEQLDSSNDQDIPYQREWRLGSQGLSMILSSFPQVLTIFFYKRRCQYRGMTLLWRISPLVKLTRSWSARSLEMIL